VVGDQDLVAGGQREGAEEGVYAGGGVGHKRETRGFCPEERRQLCSRFIEEALEVSP
jgi:hypothetical protein